MAHRAIGASLKRLDKETGGADSSLRERLTTYSSFFEVDCDSLDFGRQSLAYELGVNAQTTSDSELALRLLKRSASNISYIRPDREIVSLPRTEAARVYVLGPPADPGIKPTAQPARHRSLYLTASTGLVTFAAAALGREQVSEGGEESEEVNSVDRNELCNPFPREYRIAYRKAGVTGLCQPAYGFQSVDHSATWRQIETDWLFGSEQLAQELETHVNNTSLALAIEVGQPGSGRVLIFAADAVDGSWISWNRLHWPAPYSYSAGDLFRRTVLYKVGHHGSHFGTLKRDEQGNDYGIELMPEGFIAMMPVDAALARDRFGWNLPDPHLHTALQRKTRGNLLRSDDDYHGMTPGRQTEAVPGLRGLNWRRSIQTKHDSSKPLFYDAFIGAETR
jgi:hypothetical protein